MGLVNTGITSTQCVQLNILLYFLCCGPIFLLEVLDILCRHMDSHGHMDSIKYQQIKKINKWLTLLEILCHVWIFHPYNNPNSNLKNNTKMCHWAQNQASAMAIAVLWPEPCRKRVRWTEEKNRHGDVNLKDLEWFWMKGCLWSLVRCSLTSSGIRGNLEL